jgi:hypothetical protein
MLNQATISSASHPAFAGLAQILPLSGFSGAVIGLVKQAGGAQFVRKASATSAANAALEKQAARQAWLRGVLDGAALVPDIFHQGEQDGLFYFDMEFVPSRDANSFLATASFNDLEGFVGRIEALMTRLASMTLDCDRAVAPNLDAIRRKLVEISQRTGFRYEAILEPLTRSLDLLDCYAAAPAPTVTHGDLTFENILINGRGQLILIDSIESPIDHYWIDWSKLFQDCEGRWCQHRGKPISLGVTWWLRNRWLEAAQRIAPDYALRHYVLLALTFARILPYARSVDDLAFVTARVERFGRAALEKLQGNSP